jgi:UDP-GlcNAc:undecaprenyl-phosphate/decaprenyl-phosphate GlcNAc-1-phosphate transferase
MSHLLLNIFCSILFSFLFTYICIPPIVRICKVKNLVDVPNSRKLNKQSIPTLGGVSIFIGVTLSSILFLGNIQFHELRYILGSIIMLFFIGLKDDILIISPKKKLIVQVAAAAMLVVLGKFQITNLSNLFFINHVSIWISVPLSFLILLLIINAINLIDGIDGLAAGITIFVSGTLGAWFIITGYIAYAILSFAIVGSLLAFLRFNLWGGDLKIFMGDTGSLILGCLLGILVIKFLNFNIVAPYPFGIHNAPSFVLSLLIVPITDTLRVFAVRIYHKRSPFSADKNHIHHILIKSGMNHIQASGFLVLYTSFFVLFSITTQHYLSITSSFVLILSASFVAVGLLSKRKEKIMYKRAQMLRLITKIQSTGTPKEEDPFSLINSKKRIFQN